MYCVEIKPFKINIWILMKKLGNCGWHVLYFIISVRKPMTATPHERLDKENFKVFSFLRSHSC